MRRSSRLVLLLSVFCLHNAASAQYLDAVDADRMRIQAHLAEVEAELRAADVAHLSAAQRQARADALDQLAAYWRAGEFPHNGEVSGRNPVFIDEDGRACAVGHLLIVTGHEEVAERISDTQNLARVPEIDDPALAPWLDAHGFTVEEAARIQPSYCFCGFEEAPVCGADGITYENECTATECRGVAVSSVGECSPGDEIVRDCACTGPEEDGGCAVVAPGAGRSSAPAWLAIFLAVLAFRRWRH